MPLSPIQLETQIQDLLEGTLAVPHWPELREELMTSEEARRIYCQYARMQSLLHQRAKGIKSLTSPTPVIPMADLVRERQRKSIRTATLVAVAVLVITLVAMRLIFVPEIQPTLTFAEAPGTLSKLTHDGSAEVPGGVVMEPGSRLQISQGTVELRFASGVRSVVQAPADVTLHEDDTLYMREGVAWFHVPAEAVGFQVKTSDLDIVDLGTEFGVLARPDEHDEVHVFKGKIKVTATRLRKKSAMLVAGEARRIDPVGQLDTVPTRATAFLTKLPNSLPHLHWSFDGKDKELYQVSGNHPAADSLLSKAVATDALNPFASTPGRFGAALSSTGRGGYMTTDWSGIAGNAPRTIAYWLRLPPGEKYLHPIVGWGERDDSLDAATTRSFFSFVESTEHGVTAGLACGGYWLKGTTPIADGQWHHVAHVYTGKANSDGDPEIYSYIDGRLEQANRFAIPGISRDSHGNITLNTAIDSTSSVPLKVFNHLWKTKWENYTIAPSIDELFVFPAALSSQQIRNVYLKNQLNP